MVWVVVSSSDVSSSDDDELSIGFNGTIAGVGLAGAGLCSVIWMLFPPSSCKEPLRFRRIKKKATIKMITKKAAPPMTIPAMAPPERTGELEAAGTGSAVGGTAQTILTP